MSSNSSLPTYLSTSRKLDPLLRTSNQNKSELDDRRNVPIGQRESFDPASPRVLAAHSQLRATKLAIYKDISGFYHQEKNRRQFLRRWKELHAPAVVAVNLDMRLKRATEGKDAANE